MRGRGASGDYSKGAGKGVVLTTLEQETLFKHTASLPARSILESSAQDALVRAGYQSTQNYESCRERKQLIWMRSLFPLMKLLWLQVIMAYRHLVLSRPSTLVTTARLHSWQSSQSISVVGSQNKRFRDQLKFTCWCSGGCGWDQRANWPARRLRAHRRAAARGRARRWRCAHTRPTTFPYIHI